MVCIPKPGAVSETLVGESFSSAMRGRSSPGAVSEAITGGICCFSASPAPTLLMLNSSICLVAVVAAHCSSAEHSAERVPADCVAVIGGCICCCCANCCCVLLIGGNVEVIQVFVAAAAAEMLVVACVIEEGVVVGRQTPPITLRCVCCLMGGEQHSGDISVHLDSALLGCKRSGDNARRNSGELGSDDFVRTKPDFLLPAVTVCTTGNEPPGLYDCVVFEEPG